RETVITRAFSGRPARAIENSFSAALSGSAPAFYPQLHFLTAGLRKEANVRGDAENLNLWAGTGFVHAKEEPAADIARRLLAAHD
ncbi:MAG: nitronate monooxygenase, partial [Corynebacterium flavescens]